MKTLLLQILITLTSFIVIEANGQQKQLSVSYYPGTKVKKVEYEYVSGKAGTATNIQIRDDKTKLLKSVDQNSYSINSMTPHGYRKEYYPNGTLSKVLNYNYGVKQGLAKEYYETGVLKNQYNFNNDIIDGEFSEFYENGKLQSKCTYTYGKRSGNSTVLDEEGNPIVYLKYLDHDTKDLSPVKVSFQTKYTNGKIHEDGFLSSTYSQDRFPFSFYYDDFKRQGTFKSFDENGVLAGETNYDRDMPTSMTTLYDNGNKWEEKIYTIFKYEGKIIPIVDGPYKAYYENGQLANSGTIKTLVTKSKNQPGELETEEYKAGDWRHYNENGKLTGFISLGRGDTTLCRLDEKEIAEQSNISESLDLSIYKSRSIDKFGKYLRFNYPIINFDNLGDARRGFFEDVYNKSMTVVNEFNASMAKCTTKECVTNYSTKLDRVYNKLEVLRKATLAAIAGNTKEMDEFSERMGFYGIKSALGVQ